MTDTVQSRLPRRMLERPCYGSARCAAGPDELCVTRDGTPMLDRTHVDRRINTNTSPMGAIAPAAQLRRRPPTENEVRADERAQITRELTGWLSGLAHRDPRTAGVLAAIERIGGDR